MHLIKHLPHCLCKLTPFMSHLQKSTTKGHNCVKTQNLYIESSQYQKIMKREKNKDKQEKISANFEH